MVVAAEELDQIVTHLSSQERPQVIEQLVSLFPFRGDDLFDGNDSLYAIELVDGSPYNAGCAFADHLFFLLEKNGYDHIVGDDFEFGEIVLWIGVLLDSIFVDNKVDFGEYQFGLLPCGKIECT